VDGFVVPTKRHIHIRREDGTPDLSWIPIALDLSNISFGERRRESCVVNRKSRYSNFIPIRSMP
jgi:hypothetical protein